MKNYLYENFDVKGLVITEANKSQLQEGVLAKVKGPSFFLDGFSRNGRFYPKSLWENALKNPETKDTLSRGLMFGCIGHPKDYSLDELLESGRVSHKVTDIYVDQKTGVGMAEYEILDTPSGRILNTVLRSGSEMYVSTRAFGGFTNKTKDKDGKKYKILDDSNFVIETIDFVIQPGFLETKPELMESLAEDFQELKEKSLEHPIECEDGICGLKLPSLDEVVQDHDEKSEIDGESELSENGDNEPKENVMFDRELVENLDKSDIINMLENVMNENKLLAVSEEFGTEGSGSDGDMMVSAKLMMNYVSYVELLTKLVRYNVEYEKFYDQLIEFLDKDSKLTTDDMASLDSICDDILKEKDVDESIEKTCERIKDLAEKINSDGTEDAKEKTDKEGKEKDDKEKVGNREEDTSPEIKSKGESFVDFMLEMNLAIQTENDSIKEDIEAKETLIREQARQLIQMKESTKFLTKKLDEEMSKDPIIEKVVETKIEYQVPEDITEKFQSLTEQVQEESTKTERLQEIIEQSNREFADMSELHQAVSEELEELKSSITEKEEEDKMYFREILEEKQTEYDKVVSLYEELESDLKETKKAKEETDGKLSEYKEALLETKAKYYASMYKVELPEVRKLMETHRSDEKLQEVLSKKEKLNKREESRVIEVPEYRPNASSRGKKSFLENLTR